jgi:hypothetical protein
MPELYHHPAIQQDVDDLAFTKLGVHFLTYLQVHDAPLFQKKSLFGQIRYLSRYPLVGCQFR